MTTQNGAENSHAGWSKANIPVTNRRLGTRAIYVTGVAINVAMAMGQCYGSQNDEIVVPVS